MKKLLINILLLAFVSNIALADCDFKTGITPLEDGSYKYSKECHIKVGNLKLELDSANSQIADYKKAIELKDLALVKTEARVALWTDTSYRLEERLNKIDELRTKNEVLYFGLGVIFTGLAVWGAGQLAHH